MSNSQSTSKPRKRKVIALIDGEHYPPVIIDALNVIRKSYSLVGAVFLGGTEKIKEGFSEKEFGVKVFAEKNIVVSLEKALTETEPELVIDLSDEPVVGYKERFLLASESLSRGLSYVGSDFTLNPPALNEKSKKPAVSIIGTGKRTGKTAVSAYFCRILKEKRLRPVVVAMGRGGPKKPEIIKGDEIELTPEYLLEMSRKGFHAASDHFEDALMSRIITVGCRRCGGGLAGQPFVSNVWDGAAAANQIDGDIVIFEGSGSAIPPVATNRRILIAGANQPIDYICGLLGSYRILISDLVILTNCEGPLTDMQKVESIIAGIAEIKDVQTIKTIFRPKPLGSIEGKKVGYFTTAPRSITGRLAHHLEENYMCKVVGVSCSLSNRPELRKDLKEIGKEADIFLTELKAAAIDVVAEEANAMGKKVIFCDNIPLSIDGEPLDEIFLRIARDAIVDYKKKSSARNK